MTHVQFALQGLAGLSLFADDENTVVVIDRQIFDLAVGPLNSLEERE